MIDRYEIGERQTSACGMPTGGWRRSGWRTPCARTSAARRPPPTRHQPVRLPFTFSTFDYRELCRIIRERSEGGFEPAKVEGRAGYVVRTDRGDLTAPLIVDALGWKRILAIKGYQPPDAPLSRGLEVHPEGGGERPG